MKQRAVFLDRDGTINKEIGYLYKIADFEFIPGVPEGIRMLNRHGFKVIVITNQAGIARGYYHESDVLKLHNFINQELQKFGAHIDAFYFCPHHPIMGIKQYKIDCECRKPKPGLIFRAAKELNIDLSNSIMVGDKADDVNAGINAGVTSILVKTGYGLESSSLLKTRVQVYNNLLDVAICLCMD